MKTIGQKVQMTSDAVENYGEKYAKMWLTVSHVATKYMPAKEFFANGSPDGYHPGYDDGAGCALYDFEETNFSLYEWEIK